MSAEATAQPGRAVVWMRRVVTGLSLIWALVIAVVFACRIGFPLELEWMEGGTLQQAWRVQQGLPVYGPPSPDFVPFLYTPLYPAVVAALGFVVPLGYGLARAVSIAAVIATCAALWRLCRIEDKPRAHAWFAIGLFLSGYVFCFRWLDIARGDALFLALLIWGLVLLRESEGSLARAVLAGVLVALAFWTKQTAAVFVVISGVAGLLIAPRQIWAYAGTIALIDGGGVLLGQWLTDGWLWTWIYEMHQGHAFNDERFWSKTWGMFAHAQPFAASLLVVLLGFGVGVGLRRARQLGRPPTWPRTLWVGLRGIRGPIYWGMVAAGGLLVSALGYSTQFAEPNAFIPGVCFCAAFLAVALPHADARRRLELLGLTLVALQLCFALAVEPMYQPIQSNGVRAGLRHSYAWQDPWRTIPTARQRDNARALRAKVEALDGASLLALHRPWWPIMAGGTGHVGAMGITDVTPEQRTELQRAIRQRIAAGEIQAVWIDGSVPGWLTRELSDWTVHERRWGGRRVRPLSGWMSEAGMVTPWRGEQLLLGPSQPREVPAGVQVIADFEAGTLDGFEVVSGTAFGRRSVRSFSRGLPPLGPHGGARLLSSAASRKQLQGRGELRSAPFVLPAGGAVELLVGTTGRRKSLAAKLVSNDGRSVNLKLPKTRFDLRRVRWVVPSDWADVEVRLHVVDNDPRAALLIDDLWLWEVAPGPR
ncbi:Glycosyl transferase, family 2 [Enhygromyxa salina]|uniref:Glycosyl transferase, family 2 n=1 Tax=Enhygromyxa salina TaxID=215803 RepID=A0A0C2A098_9BACT|nr:glycosyltransferase family 87 protein [Enhygromyxa salina]KIG16793.1 Glycosyl transferase, family 2 [Enhygromyxa salina]